MAVATLQKSGAGEGIRTLDPNLGKWPPNPVLRTVNMGPVLEVALDYNPLRYHPLFKVHKWGTGDEGEELGRNIGDRIAVGSSSASECAIWGTRCPEEEVGDSCEGTGETKTSATTSTHCETNAATVPP
jgi:hypothetical protein